MQSSPVLFIMYTCVFVFVCVFACLCICVFVYMLITIVMIWFQLKFDELEMKYKKVMMSSAQLDNERHSHQYQIELLKDQVSDLEEEQTELKRKVQHVSQVGVQHSILGGGCILISVSRQFLFLGHLMYELKFTGRCLLKIFV